MTGHGLDLIRLPKRVFGLAVFLLSLFMAECACATPLDCTMPIRLAVDRWLLDQKPSGFMPYGFDFLEGKESEPDSMSAPNLVRQAYAAAVFADYYNSTHDERARPALQRLLTAMGRSSLPIGKSKTQALIEKTRILSMPFGRYKITAALDTLGLLYDPTGSGMLLSPSADYSNAYTGATALALLTELRYSQASGHASFSALRDSWLDGLLAMRIPGDGFRKFPTSIDTVPYFDGEPWLALALYHAIFPHEPRVVEILPDVDAALMKKYSGDFEFDFFHWGVMAAALRYADTKDQKFLDFVKTLTQGFLDYNKAKLKNDNNCALVEGVADALGAMHNAGEGGSELAQKAHEWAKAEMTKAMQLQIQPGQTEVVFANAKVVAARMQGFSGHFRGGIYTFDTQVDLTAHCVSALLKLRRYGLICAGE